jgi:hypothetical protein
MRSVGVTISRVLWNWDMRSDKTKWQELHLQWKLYMKGFK